MWLLGKEGEKEGGRKGEMWGGRCVCVCVCEMEGRLRQGDQRTGSGERERKGTELPSLLLLLP